MNTKKKLIDLNGFGPKSQQALNKIGIFTQADLAAIGAVRAFVKLQEQDALKPSLNFLYAIEGVLQHRDWREIAREEKGRLLMELEDYKEHQAAMTSTMIKETKK